jgi:DNA-binding NtrC family response regulator
MSIVGAERQTRVDTYPGHRRRTAGVGQFTEKISKNGFHVETFLEAKKAINRVETAPYDIVLTDIRMPDMDGMQVLDRVKANFPQTQVIMITGYASIENAVEAVKQGAFYYVEKSFAPEQIMLVVNRVVDKSHLVYENRRLKEDLLRKDHVREKQKRVSTYRCRSVP